MNANKEYQQYVLQSNLSNQTKRAYLSRLDSFVSFLDNQAGLDKNHLDKLLQRYQAHLSGDLFLKGSTVNRYVGTARDYISFLGVAPPAVPRIDEVDQATVRLSQADEATILQLIETPPCNRDRLLIKLMLFAALRPSECCSLKWSDLVDDGANLSDKIGINNKTRLVPLKKSIEDDLLHWFDQQSQRSLTALVFTTRDGSPLSPGSLDRIIKSHCHRAHINTSCMALRNTCIAHWLEEEPVMLKVAKLAEISLESLTKFKTYD